MEENTSIYKLDNLTREYSYLPTRAEEYIVVNTILNKHNEPIKSYDIHIYDINGMKIKEERLKQNVRKRLLNHIPGHSNFEDTLIRFSTIKKKLPRSKAPQRYCKYIPPYGYRYGNKEPVFGGLNQQQAGKLPFELDRNFFRVA